MLNADHIIDLGPLGGYRGGEIVAHGTPEEVARHPTSLTALFLKPALERRGAQVDTAVSAKRPRKAKAAAK
jgi:excinuclease ABC subunit A